MTTIAMPTILDPYTQNFGLKANTRVFTSPFTGVIQTQTTPGSRWLCSYEYPILSNDHTKVIKAFLVKLKGQANRFTARDYLFTGQDLTLTATATLGASTAIISASATFSEGDYINIGGELKMIVSDSTGTTITVEPAFRAAQSGATVVTQYPTCDMVLDQDTVSWKSISPALSSLEFSGSEAIS